MKSLFCSGKTNFLFVLLIITAFGACKKSIVKPETDSGGASTELNTKQTVTTNRRELTSDSLFLYAKQIYYWNSTLPSFDVFDPRSYKTLGTDLANYNNELFNITKYSNFETVPGLNSPKYAFISDEKTSNGSQGSLPGTEASVDLTSTGYDMGFLFFSYNGTNSSYEVYVNAVYPNSPAAKAGITRGTVLTKIGNLPIGTNFNAQVSAINGVLDNAVTSALFSGIRPDGTTFTNVSLTVSKYTSSPVFNSKVISQGGKKIGYLAYSRFSVLTDPDNTPSDTRLDPVFADFATNGVTDLIIDLRYNGGGSVQTAEYLLNLMAPSTAQGLMYQEIYNTTMKTGKATILINQPYTDASGKIEYNPSTGKMYTLKDVDWTDEGNRFNFSKKGQLGGVKNIVFLVSGNTASASELVINCIKPHVQSVKLVGEKTYGKPVGFFPILLENRYNVYIPSFESKNSKGEGGYYAGMTPDYVDDGKTIFDDFLHDFGDVRESYLSTALSILAPVKAVTSGSRISSVGPGGNAIPEKISRLGSSSENTGTKIMVETRYRLKK